MKHPHAVLVQPSKHPPPASIDPCRSQVNLDIKSNQEAETAVSRLFFECVWIWLFTGWISYGRAGNFFLDKSSRMALFFHRVWQIKWLGMDEITMVFHGVFTILGMNIQRFSTVKIVFSWQTRGFHGEFDPSSPFLTEKCWLKPCRWSRHTHTLTYVQTERWDLSTEIILKKKNTSYLDVIKGYEQSTKALLDWCWKLSSSYLGVLSVACASSVCSTSYTVD